MKTRSFAIDLLLLASILFSTSCAAPTPVASPTPPATQTFSPTATQTTVPTVTPTATETPVPAEFIPLSVKSTKFSETKDGVTTNIVLSMDASMKMRSIDEKADEFVKNTNFPGGADEAMNAYARGFLYETAILTNENAKGMSEDEYLEALRFAQENPNDEKAWEKVEIKVYDDATKTTKNVRFGIDTELDLIFVHANQTDGWTSTWSDGWNEGLRIEVDSGVIRIIRALDNYGYDTTAFRPFIHQMVALPNLLAQYTGQPIIYNTGANRSKNLIKLINVYNTYICAFRVFLNGKPASLTEARQNP